jgi:hypothetical protein
VADNVELKVNAFAHFPEGTKVALHDRTSQGFDSAWTGDPVRSGTVGKDGELSWKVPEGTYWLVGDVESPVHLDDRGKPQERTRHVLVHAVNK